MDFAEKLEWIDKEYLSAYDAITLDSAVKEQAAFEEAKRNQLPVSDRKRESFTEQHLSDLTIP